MMVDMINSIREVREREKNGLYHLKLEIPEKEFFLAYDDPDVEAAHDIIKQYLVHRQDDARPENIDIQYNKNSHMININSELHYLGNDHTDY